MIQAAKTVAPSATFAFLMLANAWLAAGYETVYVSRHCARSTPMTVYGGPSDYQYMDNFSSIPFPSWGVDTYLCLPRGTKIVETFGKNLRKTGFPTPFKTTSDTAQRDKTTAKALLTGLGLPVDYDVQPTLFNPTESGVCKALPMQEQIEAMTETFNEIFKDPSAVKEHQQRLANIQKVMGKGAAPPMQTFKETITAGTWGGTYSGGAAVANCVTEAFLMQNGGGIEMAWGKLDVDTLYGDFLKAHILYRHVMCRTKKVAQHRHSNMLKAILDALVDTGSKGTRMFVGHDGDLDGLAAILGLSWHATPYPINSTTPNSGLRFDVYEENGKKNIRINVYYTTFETDDAPVMVVPANFSGSSKNTMPWNDFQTFAEGEMDMSCVEKR